MIKIELLKTLYDHLLILKTAHFNYGLNIKRAIEHINRSWYSSIFGQFEGRLNKLLKQLVIFTFHGQSFDMLYLAQMGGLADCNIVCLDKVFLDQSLGSVSYLETKTRFQISIQKKGSKVSRISVRKSGLVFLDICKMLSPETSLLDFGNLVGLNKTHKIEKSVFPFDLLKDLTFLDQPNLPSDEKSWFSSLSGPVSKKRIFEAHEQFQKAGCSTVADFLVHYLRLDSDITLLATITYFDKLNELLKSHPMDLCCFSLASYSYNSVLNYLANKKRFGNYFVNHSVIYAHLHGSLVGGCSIVTTRDSSKDLDASQYGINTHIFGKDSLKPNYVTYLGITTLL